ncbi:MAG: hypothetical protein CVU41_17790 [Chloroflexi bacterium HGW-Chloroflexi-3]|nr:MAG: hypothetical protein CVU41_17790 [Chloroflexi bacterium HGW-Chloroflexi-3]
MQEKRNPDLPLVKSAVRSLDILELLAEYSEGLHLTEVGKRLKIPLSSLHNLMATLVYRGYLLKSEGANIYQLGPKFAQLQASYDADINLTKIVEPYMDRLQNLTGETSGLSVLQGSTIVFINKHSGKELLQVINPVGTRLLAHATGSGKAMLAHLSNDEIDKIYPKEQLPVRTPFTIKNKSQLKKALAVIRHKGYAFDEQESEIGVWAVASCIKNREGAPIAALSIVAPLVRLETKEHSEWYELIKRIADEISARLGYLPVELQEFSMTSFENNNQE